MVRDVLEGSHAVALAVKQAGVKVISAYPITPSTHIVEKLSEYVDFGEMDAEFIRVESEFSALSGCIGAAASGVRTFTATASQGLALMTELLPVASVMRLPIVMAVGNRALSAPINIWNDHSDIMIQRDHGWIILFASNVQEAYDLTIIAYNIAEKSKLPVIVNLDGFYLTHLYEDLEIESDEGVRKYLGEYEPKDNILDTDNPITMGPLGMPKEYYKIRKEFYNILNDSKENIINSFDKFESRFGRKYELFRILGDSDKVIVSMGSVSETIYESVKNLGWSVIDLKVYRPFPKEELYYILKDKSKVVVFEKHVSYGSMPPLYLEISDLLRNTDVEVYSLVGGIGGKDVRRTDIVNKINSTLNEGEINWLN